MPRKPAGITPWTGSTIGEIDKTVRAPNRRRVVARPCPNTVPEEIQVIVRNARFELLKSKWGGSTQRPPLGAPKNHQRGKTAKA